MPMTSRCVDQQYHDFPYQIPPTSQPTSIRKALPSMYAINTDEARKATAPDPDPRQPHTLAQIHPDRGHCFQEHRDKGKICISDSDRSAAKGSVAVLDPMSRSPTWRAASGHGTMAYGTDDVPQIAKDIYQPPARCRFTTTTRRRTSHGDLPLFFADLANKPIGVLAGNRGVYQQQQRRRGFPCLVFESTSIKKARTRLTASEILDRKTTPQMLDKRLTASLRHRPAKKGARSTERRPRI